MGGMAGRSPHAAADPVRLSEADASAFAVEEVNDLLGPVELELTERFGQVWPEWLRSSFDETRRHAVAVVTDSYRRFGSMAKARASLPPAPDGVTDQGLLWNSKGIRRA